MRIHPVQIDDTEATAIENIALGAICVAPIVIDKEISLSEDEKLLIRQKANLLCKFLQDEQFLSEIAGLYEDQIHLPPLFVSFNRFSKNDKGTGFHGNTYEHIINVGDQEGRLIELNFLDADSKLRDIDRLFYLWTGFFSLALCHSPSRPKKLDEVMIWSESEAKRAWLYALYKGKIKTPRKKYVMGIERSNFIRARTTPFEQNDGSFLFTFPIHFQPAEEYRRKYKRECEHLLPESKFEEKYDFSVSPPWRWNNTSGFIDIYETQNRGLLANIHIATTHKKIMLHGSVEPARASATSGRIYRFFNKLMWDKAFISGNPNEKLNLFLDLLDTYIKSVFDWNCDILQLQKIIGKIQI